MAPTTTRVRAFVQKDGRMRITLGKDDTQAMLANGFAARGNLILTIENQQAHLKKPEF